MEGPTESGRKPISSLSKTTVQLISSTQIITSVSSIVKELVENSLDAGATVLKVKLEDNGLSKLEVIDNGQGVTPADAAVMCLPHFTSKIEKEMDLQKLYTYGFRGEALSAVCNVANVVITTATDDTGGATTYYFNHSGDIIDSRPSHLGKGTSITVTQLFHNIPVRKQYYQSTQNKKQELVATEKLLMAFGLIHPQMHFTLHHNRCLLWQKNRANDLKDNINQVLGRNIYSHLEMKYMTEEESQAKICLFVPKRSAPKDVCFRQRADRSFIFINKRPVVYKSIEKVLKELYEPVLADEGRSAMFPVCVITIEVPPDRVDVNLEPNKTTVLLQCEKEVLETIEKGVKEVLDISSLDQDNSEQQHPKASRNTENEALGSRQASEAGQQQHISPSKQQTPELLLNEEDFHGFFEPWDVENIDKANNGTNKAPETSSEDRRSEWSRGVACDANGRIVHPAEILRADPMLKKRIMDVDLEEEGPPRKQANVVLPASKLATQPRDQFKMVNNSFVAEPKSAYDEYCDEMKAQLLAQNPSLRLNELMKLLDEGWRNLDDESRKKYDKKGFKNKQTHQEHCRRAKLKLPQIGAHTLDRFLAPSTPKILANSNVPVRRKEPVMKPFYRDVDCSIDLLRRQSSDESFYESANESWKCIGKIPGTRTWACLSGSKITLVNIPRLQEALFYGRLYENHRLSRRDLNPPLPLDVKSLGSHELWQTLINLDNELKENSSEARIIDSCLLMNGFVIHLCSDPHGNFRRALVMEVPAHVCNIGVEEIREILMAKTNPDASHCHRPPKISAHLKAEAARMIQQRPIDFSPAEVEDLLKTWSAKKPANECLHGNPITEEIFQL